MLATLFTLAVAGCTEGGTVGMTKAEPEVFDAATVYQIVPVGSRPSQPGEPGYELGSFLRFDTEEAKRAFADLLAKDARNQLVALSPELAIRAWNDKRPVTVWGTAAKGCCRLIHSYNYDLVAVQRALYGPKNRKPAQNEAPR